MRRVLFLAFAAAACVVGTLARGQEPTPAPAAATRAVGSGRFAALANALALYSPFESPWAGLRVNHAAESRLFALMRAELRLWDLHEALAAQEGPARDDTLEVARIIHAQVLAEAADALPLLQKTPNKPFAGLLVRQLEAYPYAWQEEGTENLLPNLRKTLEPAAGKPPAAENTVRRRRRAAKPAPPPSPSPEIPVAPAVRPR